MVSVGAFNVEVVSEATLPSTLVQVLHLFYFLPNDPIRHLGERYVYM